MNSLEFIEELINNIETNIYITESVLKTYDEDSDDEEEVNILKNNLEYLKERLKYSKQIKTELEAWEIVKKYVKEVSINGIVFEHIINVSHTKQNYDIVKKALGVKDE